MNIAVVGDRQPELLQVSLIVRTLSRTSGILDSRFQPPATRPNPGKDG